MYLTFGRVALGLLQPMASRKGMVRTAARVPVKWKIVLGIKLEGREVLFEMNGSKDVVFFRHPLPLKELPYSAKIL